MLENLVPLPSLNPQKRRRAEVRQLRGEQDFPGLFGVPPPIDDLMWQPQAAREAYHPQSRQLPAGKGIRRSRGESEDGEGRRRPEQLLRQLMHIARPSSHSTPARRRRQADAGAIGTNQPDIQFLEDLVQLRKALQPRTLEAVEVKNRSTRARTAVHVGQGAAVAQCHLAECRIGFRRRRPQTGKALHQFGHREAQTLQVLKGIGRWNNRLADAYVKSERRLRPAGLQGGVDNVFGCPVQPQPADGHRYNRTTALGRCNHHARMPVHQLSRRIGDRAARRKDNDCVPGALPKVRRDNVRQPFSPRRPAPAFVRNQESDSIMMQNPALRPHHPIPAFRRHHDARHKLGMRGQQVSQ